MLPSENAQSTTPPGGTVDSYIRNVTWGTLLVKTSPFQKGNELEFLSVIDPGDALSFRTDLQKLVSNLDNVQIEINGKPASIGEIVVGTGATYIKIKGQAKTDGTADYTDATGTGVVEFLGEKPEPEPISEKTAPEILPGFSVSPEKTDYPSEIGNVVIFSGNGVSRINSVMIGGQAFRGSFLSDGRYAVTVERRALVGDFFVAFLLTDGKLVSMDGKLSFSGTSDPIGVAAVTPATVPSSRDSFIVLQGFGFSKLLSIQL